MASAESDPNAALDHILQCTQCKKKTNLHSLQKCLHSYCEECLDGIRKTDQETKVGYVCSACSCYSSEENITHNAFLTDLSQLSTEQNESEVKPSQPCMQCLKDDKLSTGKCVECKLLLCEDCQVIHQQIPVLKNHIITKLEDDKEVVIDKLIICSSHDSQPIEYNCKTCEKVICSTCNLCDHNIHTTETITQALDRLKPEMESNSASIKVNMKTLEAQIESISKEIEQMKEKYSSCRLEMDERLEVVINRLKAVKAEMEEEINEQETIVLDILKTIQSNLENQLSLGRNLTSLVDVTTDKSRHLSLLNEIQSGLYKKVNDEFQNLKDSFEFQVKTPYIKDQQNLDEMATRLRNLIADVTFEEPLCKVDSLGVIWGENEFICDDLEQVFKQTFTKDLEIDIKTPWANRLSYIDNKVILPCCNSGTILVYNNLGKLVHSIENHNCIIVLKKANNGDFIAGGLNGLYVTDTKFSKWTKLADGRYSDICVHEERFSVCEYEDSQIKTFKLGKNIGTKEVKWLEEKTFNVNIELDSNSTLVTNGTLFLVCTENFIYQISENGDILYQNQSKLCAAVCGCDKHCKIAVQDFYFGNIYLSSFENTKNLSSKQSCNTKYRGSQLRDFVADSECNVWYLEGNEDDYKIVKYKHK